MIGLLFLSLAILWLAVVVYLTIKIPRWCGVVRHAWLLRLLLFPLLLVGPFVDHIVGMRQFERLCEERAMLIVSADAELVKRAKVTHSDRQELPGYWLISISASRSTYIDIDTGKVFMTFDNFSTNGGLFGSVVFLGQPRSCSAQRDRQAEALAKRINLQKLLDAGYKS